MINELIASYTTCSRRKEVVKRDGMFLIMLALRSFPFFLNDAADKIGDIHLGALLMNISSSH